MKRTIILLETFMLFLFFSCKDNNDRATGTVVFGANYGIISCITTVNVFIDDKHVGQLEAPTDSVPNCDVNYGVKMELSAGHHNYKVEIRPLMGSDCSEDVSGELDIKEGGCEIVFINYLEIFAD